MTDFSTWSRESLEKFAQVAAIELQFLRDELKAALKAYREINTQEKSK